MPEILTQGLITLSQSEPSQEGLFKSQHWVNIPITNDRNLLTTAGVVILKDNQDNYQGLTSDEWRHDRLRLKILIPDYVRPSGKVFQIEQWAPFITINAIFNKDEAINAGWAVDEFDMIIPDDKILNGYVEMYADIAVRDSDGILYRLGYTLSMTGKFVTPVYPPIE
jgi:hypothetical protein